MPSNTRNADQDRLILIEKTEVWRFERAFCNESGKFRLPDEEAAMKQSLLALRALLFAGLGLSFSPRSGPQETNEPYKITPEDIARTNPVKPTPEGLAAARRVFGYDCSLCHGAQGDGKGEVVESMKLTMRDLRDPATLAGKIDGELFFIITKGKGK
jgi:hypothetical protein